jgi:hypothetical protein
MSNMSLRAELVRLCLPWFMRPRFPPEVQIEDVGRRMTRFVHLIPPPPRGTEVIAVDAGGVKAERITTPRSLHNRYVAHPARSTRSDGGHWCVQVVMIRRSEQDGNAERS